MNRTTPSEVKPRATPRQRLTALFLAFSDIYGLPMGLFVLLRLLTGYRFWPVAFFSQTLPWTLLIAPPLLIVLFAKRRWYRAVPAAIVTTALFVWYGPLFLPKPAVSCSSPCDALTIMQYNIAEGRTPTADLLRVLRESGADIITLQEVETSQAKAILDDLSDVYPYQIAEEDRGNGLFSHYPLRDHAYLDLPGRSYLRADLDVNGQPLIVISAHPQVAYVDLQKWSYISRSRSALVSLAEMASQGTPTLIAGDFNMVDQSADYDLMLQAGLHDAFRDQGWGLGLTYPTAHAIAPIRLAPFLRIDFIWHTQQLRTLRAWVGPDGGSDHLPVFAMFAWQ